MPKYTNTCAICGTPIIKSKNLCARCEMRNQEAEKEIEIQRIRLIPELLWEKRRYEIAKELLPGRIASACGNAHRAAQEAVEYADLLIAELKKEESK